MLKVTKLSATVLIFYILFYLQIWGDNHAILYGSAIVTVLSLAVHCFYTGYANLSNVPYGVWNNLLMVGYALLIGYFVSYDYSTTIGSSITLAAYSIVSIAICYVSAEEGSFDWVLIVLTTLAILCSAYALVRGVVWEGYGRTLSYTNNPHVFAAVMNLGIFSVIYRTRDKEKKYSLVSIALVVLFIFSTFESGSRKYLIASLCIILIWIIALLRELWTSGDAQKRLICAIVSLLIVAALIYAYRRVFTRSFVYVRLGDLDDLGNQHRLRNYRKAWEIFLEHPVLGAGYDQFRYLSGAGGYAHSTYAEAIADFGIVGCVMYFTPIAYTSFMIIKQAFTLERDYGSWLLAALCISELFIGAGQIFFMEFHHFPAWAILFYYSRKNNEAIEYNDNVPSSKYIKNAF